MSLQLRITCLIITIFEVCIIMCIFIYILYTVVVQRFAKPRAFPNPRFQLERHNGTCFWLFAYRSIDRQSFCDLINFQNIKGSQPNQVYYFMKIYILSWKGIATIPGERNIIFTWVQWTNMIQLLVKDERCKNITFATGKLLCRRP